MEELPILVMGASAGGMRAVERILAELGQIETPILVAQHVASTSSSLIAEILHDKCGISAKEAEDKDTIRPGVVYFAPPNYHLLVEKVHTLALSVDEKENYSRPAIDVLFESVAEAYGENTIGVLLTGANSDGAKGLMKIKHVGGCTIVQDPATAEHPTMPESAISVGAADFVVPLERIAKFIRQRILEMRQRVS